MEIDYIYISITIFFMLLITLMFYQFNDSTPNYKSGVSLIIASVCIIIYRISMNCQISSNLTEHCVYQTLVFSKVTDKSLDRWTLTLGYSVLYFGILILVFSVINHFKSKESI